MGKSTRFLGIVIACLALLTGCGREGSNAVTPSPSASSPSPPNSPTVQPTQSGNTQRYENSAFGFALDYPADFIVRTSDPSRLRERKDGWLASDAFYHKSTSFEGPAAPNNALTVRVYERGAATTPTAWVQAHAYSGSSPARTQYFGDPKSFTSTRISDRDAVVFRWWDGQSGAGEVRSIAIFHNQVVVVIEAWAATSPSARLDVHKAMVGSWHPTT